MKKIKLSKEVISFLENQSVWNIYIPTDDNQNPKHIKMFQLTDQYYIETPEEDVYLAISVTQAIRNSIVNALIIDKDIVKLIDHDK